MFHIHYLSIASPRPKPGRPEPLCCPLVEGNSREAHDRRLQRRGIGTGRGRPHNRMGPWPLAVLRQLLCGSEEGFSNSIRRQTFNSLVLLLLSLLTTRRRWSHNPRKSLTTPRRWSWLFGRLTKPRCLQVASTQIHHDRG